MKTISFEQAHTLLPCYFCRKLEQEFVGQSAVIAVLNNGIATVRVPICPAHAKWPAVRLWDVVQGCQFARYE